MELRRFQNLKCPECGSQELYFMNGITDIIEGRVWCDKGHISILTLVSVSGTVLKKGAE